MGDIVIFLISGFQRIGIDGVPGLVAKADQKL
jgi:hypothetical protein